MFTAYVTASRDNTSRYLLYSNNSSGALMGRELIRGLREGYGYAEIWSPKMVS